MHIEKITNLSQWRAVMSFEPTLDVWTFGPLAELPEGDEESDDNVVVLVALEDNEALGYITAKWGEAWCLEVAPGHRRKGVATALVAASGVDTFVEPNTASRALAEKLNLYIID